MGSESIKHFVYKNSLEEKDLKTKLARIDGEKGDRLTEINRRQDKFALRHSHLTAGGAIGIPPPKNMKTESKTHRKEPKSESAPVLKGDKMLTESKKKMNEQNLKLSKAVVRHSDIRASFSRCPKLCLRRSHTESSLKYLPDIQNYNKRCQLQRRYNNGTVATRSFDNYGSDEEGIVTEIDDETLDYSSVSISRYFRTVSDSVLGQIKQYSRSTNFSNIQHRIYSEERWNYLLRNVFERLHNGHDTRKRSDRGEESPSDYGKLRSCTVVDVLRKPEMFNNAETRENQKAIMSSTNVQMTDFKKLFGQHVQEQYNMKKHMHYLENEKHQKLQDMVHSKFSFIKKYGRYLHMRKTNTNGRNSRYSLDDISALLPQEDRNGQRHLQRNKTICGTSSVKKQSGTVSPVDFPYSFESWNNLVQSKFHSEDRHISRQFDDDDGLCITTPSSAVEEKTVEKNINDQVKLPVISEKSICKDENLTPGTEDHNDNDAGKRTTNSRHRSNSIDNGRKFREISLPNIYENDSVSHVTANTHRDDKSGFSNEGECIDGVGKRLGTPFVKFQPKSENILSRKNDHFSDENILNRRRKGRSSSLAPDMFSSFASQSKNTLLQPPIEELGSQIRQRSKSFTNIVMLRESISREKETKSSLRLMIDHSKGSRKWKYITKLLNTGLQEIKESEKAGIDTDAKDDKTSNICDCRYLRIPEPEQEEK